MKAIQTMTAALYYPIWNDLIQYSQLPEQENSSSFK